MDPKIVDKVLSRSGTPQEAREVAAWFSTEEGQQYLASRYDRETYFLNEKTFLEWLEQDIPTERMKRRFIPLLRTRVRTFRFKLAAAVIIPFLMLVGAFTFVANRSGAFASEKYASVKVPFGEQLNLVLQDGTLIQLNSGSQLNYPKTFGLFHRKVQLKGEAYFSVAKEHGRPFTVNLDGINVEVTGTKFNIKAYPDDDKINITLEEGSVNVIDKDNQVYPLKINQNAVYDRITGVCAVNEVEEMTLYTAWRSNSLNFYQTPLIEILKVLERQYEIAFTVKDSSLLDYRFSISTSKINVGETLKELEKVSNIRFKPTSEDNYTVYSQK